MKLCHTIRFTKIFEPFVGVPQVPYGCTTKDLMKTTAILNAFSCRCKYGLLGTQCLRDTINTNRRSHNFFNFYVLQKSKQWRASMA